MTEPTHLGDGVYVEGDTRRGIWLTDSEGAIHLSAAAVDELLDWIAEDTVGRLVRRMQN